LTPPEYFRIQLTMQTVLDQAARTAKALASPRRLELLERLAEGERSVEELARLTGMSVANASRHLQILKSGRVVAVRRQGLFAFYRLADERVRHVLDAIRGLGEETTPPRQGEATTPQRDEESRPPQRAPATAPPLEGIAPRDLAARLNDPGLLVLDVRSRDEYRTGHVPGALSVPLEDLPRVLPLLPAGREWIAYSRGLGCGLADEAVALLRRRGLVAVQMQGGFPAWRAAGSAWKRAPSALPGRRA
jgi:DNA-binding transcriptional ArsR family regulator/rhodanese-related sulfurtransferase